MNILGCHVRAALPPRCAENLQTAVSNLVVHYPGFLHALFDNCTIVESIELPRAGITKEGPHYTLALNFQWLSSLTSAEIVFVLCHEAMHRVLCHMELQTYARRHGMPIPQSVLSRLSPAAEKDKYRHNGAWHLPFSSKVFAVSTDALINWMLRKASIGEMPAEGIRIEELPLNAPDFDVLDTPVLHALLYGHQLGSGLEPFETMESSEAGEAGEAGEADNLDEIDRAIAVTTKTVAKLQETTSAGKGADTLDRLSRQYTEALVDWVEKLAASIFLHVGPGAEHSWRSLNRRMKPLGLTLPGTESKQAGVCILAHDVSGSICEQETIRYFAETAAILAYCQPEKIIILPVDTKVHTPIVIEFDGTTDPAHAHALITSAAANVYTGGGGTSFNPPFEWVEENFTFLDGIPPAHFIYLTDGYGRCTVEEPGYPVLWVTTGANDFPFGEIIEMKV